jgi:hypothetical protein
MRSIHPASLILLCSLGCLSSCIPVYTSQKILTKNDHREPFDAVIVPGRPYYPGKRHPDFLFKARMQWALTLYKKGLAKNIIFSGWAVYSPYKEGLIMKLYAQAMNVDSQHVFAETKAEHSTENIFYSMQMAQRLGFRRVALATDVYQLRYVRPYLCRTLHGLQLLPVNFREVKRSPKHLPAINDAAAFTGGNWKSILHRKTKSTRARESHGAAIRDLMAEQYSDYNGSKMLRANRD